MNHLFQELAPISESAWSEINAEATRTLTHFLAGRKLVDVVGPLGYECSAVSRGRLQPLSGEAGDGVVAATRQVLPLVELRRPFTLERSEVDAISRGATDADLTPLVDAARGVAAAEDTIIFEGLASAGMTGISAATPHAPIMLTTEFGRYPTSVAKAVAVLKNAGIGGPYAIALGPRCYTGVVETTEHGGYPLLQHLGLILGGPVIWAPAVDGAVVISQRGEDFTLTIGQDISIAYVSHDATTVTLELQETIAFVTSSPEAGIALRYPAEG
jgi:uncharacterized linocin/CFP29 family protein